MWMRQSWGKLQFKLKNTAAQHVAGQVGPLKPDFRRITGWQSVFISHYSDALA
jgi:hypothetical protein